jgi:RNA polymerase sigma-70 factor (ECF subfamily)
LSQPNDASRVQKPKSEPTISTPRRQFEALVDQHYESVWSYVSLLTRAAAEAEDITHQAFLLTFDRLTAGETIHDPALWLRGVARNLVRAFWREKRKLPMDLTDQLSRLVEETDDAADAELKAERQAALAGCLQDLSADEQRVVKARYQAGLRIVQIAEQEKLNVTTARVKLFRIRERLKACIEWKLAGRTVT